MSRDTIPEDELWYLNRDKKDGASYTGILSLYYWVGLQGGEFDMDILLKSGSDVSPQQAFLAFVDGRDKYLENEFGPQNSFDEESSKASLRQSSTINPEDEPRQSFGKAKKLFVRLVASSLFVIIGISIGVYYANNSERKNMSYSPVPQGTVTAPAAEITTEATAKASTKANTEKTTGTTESKKTAATVTQKNLKPVYAQTGQFLVSPSFEGQCPLTIKAGKDSDYYIYFKYLRKPPLTKESRSRINRLSHEDDLAFYVKAGDTYKTNIPVGEYELYYATGAGTFYGKKILWGADTSYYKASGKFEFSFDGEYYTGHTITLYKVSGGNLGTNKIPGTSFPGLSD